MDALFDRVDSSGLDSRKNSATASAVVETSGMLEEKGGLNKS